MNILGLNLSPHDTAAAVIKDGKVAAAIEEERLNRIRHSIGYDNSMYTLEKEAEYFDSTFLSPSEEIIQRRVDSLVTYLNVDRFDMVVGSSLLTTSIPIKNYVNVSHHLAHAYHAFYSSPYEEAAILVIDGAGDADENKLETVSLYSANKKGIELVEKVTGSIEHNTNTIIALSNSIGVMYQNASALCGFGPLGEGKLMGLSSYGDPAFLDDLKQYVSESNGILTIDNLKMYEYMRNVVEKSTDKAVLENIARSIQDLTTLCVLHYAKKIKKFTDQKNLCYAGGVALNVITNSVLLKESGFNNIYIPSAPGDNGIAIGAALYGYHHIEKKEKTTGDEVPSVYYGRNYTRNEIRTSIEECGDGLEIAELKEGELLRQVAQLLEDEKIIAWFDGSSEFGPRALGNRSIFASPKNTQIRKKINTIKGREQFRPVAPIVLQERAGEYFDLSWHARADSLPYMLFVATAQSKAIEKTIPAVIHVDGTARVQTITSTQNKRVYTLIEEFCKLSEVPLLINTSFNVKGEPIVETPQDALRSFKRSSFDYLVLNNFLIKRQT